MKTLRNFLRALISIFSAATVSSLYHNSQNWKVFISVFLIAVSLKTFFEEEK